MDISIIVPCYTEEASIPLFYKEATRVLQSLGRPYEIVFVNDGSSDKTLETVRQFSQQDPHISYLSFSRNFGKESALLAGLCNVDGDYVAVMDADLQDPPSLLPQMLSILETEDYDCVATRRATRKGEPPVRSWFAHQFYKIINKISDADIIDGARDFRLMRRNMVEAILSMNEYNRFSKGIFGWVGFKTFWLSYENVERVAGETKWSFWKLFRYAIDGIINFSQTPLSMASWFGICMTLVSFLCLIFVVVRRLIFGDPVAGWASTICILLFVSGLQLFCLGIIGQSIAKIYAETKHRPHFIISESNKDSFVNIR